MHIARMALPFLRTLVRAVVLTAFVCGVAVFAAPPKDESVIYPRSANAADATPGRPAPGGSNTSLVAAGVLLAAAGAWWLWLRQRGLTRTNLTGGARLSISESRSLGSRQYLVVADYDGKKYLLGVCPGSIELLTPLENGKGRE